MAHDTGFVYTTSHQTYSRGCMTCDDTGVRNTSILVTLIPPVGSEVCTELHEALSEVLLEVIHVWTSRSIGIKEKYRH